MSRDCCGGSSGGSGDNTRRLVPSFRTPSGSIATVAFLVGQFWFLKALPRRSGSSQKKPSRDPPPPPPQPYHRQLQRLYQADFSGKTAPQPPTHKIWYTARMLLPLREVAVKTAPPSPPPHALKHISIPSPGAFIQKSLYLEPSCWGPIQVPRLRPSYKGREGRSLGDIFPCSDLIPSTFLPPAPLLPLYSPAARVCTIAGAFCLEFPQRWDHPQPPLPKPSPGLTPCTGLLFDPLPVHLSTGENRMALESQHFLWC